MREQIDETALKSSKPITVHVLLQPASQTGWVEFSQLHCRRAILGCKLHVWATNCLDDAVAQSL